MTDVNRNEIAEMLIRFYNMQAGTSCRTRNEKSQSVVLAAYDRSGEDIIDLKNHIREWVASHKDKQDNRMMVCFESYIGKKSEPHVPEAVTDNQVNYSMGILEKAVVSMIADMNSKRIEDEIMGSVESKVREFIKAEYGHIERKIDTIIDGKHAELEGVQHEKFETILKFVANNEPVYLTGPAGSGKNVICKQIADALGLNFYFTNAVTQEYKLTGFTDAMGEYQETQFYKAFTQGGVFMLDEMDASIPEVLVILNAAIANGYFDFPAPIGFREAHPDFRVIAAGNTVGHGADFEYVGRNQLDAASLDRFAVIKVDYSSAIEKNVANGDIDLVIFCRKFRSSANKAGLNITVSYRSIKRMAKMSQLLTAEETLETCLLKGIEKDDATIILDGIGGGSNKWYVAMKNVIDTM